MMMIPLSAAASAEDDDDVGAASVFEVVVAASERGRKRTRGFIQRSLRTSGLKDRSSIAVVQSFSDELLRFSFNVNITRTNKLHF